MLIDGKNVKTTSSLDGPFLVLIPADAFGAYWHAEWCIDRREANEVAANAAANQPNTYISHPTVYRVGFAKEA